MKKTKKEAFYDLCDYEYLMGVDLIPNNNLKQLEDRRLKLLEYKDTYNKAKESDIDIKVDNILNDAGIMKAIFTKFPNAPDSNISNIRYYERKIKQLLTMIDIIDILKAD